jgi:hypothetical protein
MANAHVAHRHRAAEVAEIAERRHATLLALGLCGGLAWVAVLAKEVSPQVKLTVAACVVMLTYMSRKRTDPSDPCRGAASQRRAVNVRLCRVEGGYARPDLPR